MASGISLLGTNAAQAATITDATATSTAAIGTSGTNATPIVVTATLVSVGAAETFFVYIPTGWSYVTDPGGSCVSAQVVTNLSGGMCQAYGWSPQPGVISTNAGGSNFATTITISVTFAANSLNVGAGRNFNVIFRDDSVGSNIDTGTATLASGVGGGGSSAALTPLFGSASSNAGRFTAQVTNYDAAFTYAVTSTAGQASIDSTGLVTVTGLGIDQSVSVTVTTTRTGYSSGSASTSGRSQVAPMTPSNKPLVTLSDTLITCTIGSYSATPTSSAFSLFVDGVHISTNFSALGEYLPDWIIPWATSNTITRTAALTTASWSMSDAYKGKAITCATLAYSKNAIGLTASQVMVAR